MCIPFGKTFSAIQGHLSQSNIKVTFFKEIADDNFKLDENGKKFSKRVENTVGKGEIACYKQFLLFPQFSEDFICRQVKTRLWETNKW